MPENFTWNDLGDELPYEGTRLESVDEIRAAVGAPPRVATQQERAAPPVPPPIPDAAAFRPVMRPPMAFLCAIDDGRSDGDWEIHNLSSQNGTWIRKNRMAVSITGQFQIGEQRFALKVL